MSSASRAALRRKARSKRSEPRNRFIWIAVGAIAATLALAVVLTLPGGNGSSESDLRETAAVDISGTDLPALADGGADPAVGATMPSLSGVDFQGDEVSIADDGRAKVVMFLAHWCPHCQAEVPVVKDWLDQGRLPEEVDLYSVATATDEAQPNYPPSAWLEREGWDMPVLVDDEASSAGAAAGVSSYPFFVFVGSNGDVVQRTAGELTPEALDSAVSQLLGATDET
jgi:cytochrome c biogenesis protein CcmG, thiol:disulfide interchange protein DsbE